MTHAKVQERLLAVTKLSPKAGESAEDFTARVLKKVNSMVDANEDNWRVLGGTVDGVDGDDPVQLWVNENVGKQERDEPLELLTIPDVEAEEGPETDQAPAEEAGEQEDGVEDGKPAKANKRKPAAKKPAKVLAPKKAAPAKAAKVAAPKKPVKEAKPVAAKVAQKAKPAKKEVAGKRRGRTPMFSDAGVIKVLAKENPHREGTIRDKAFKKVKSGMTVAEAIKAGAPRQQVWSMANRGVISVQD